MGRWGCEEGGGKRGKSLWEIGVLHTAGSRAEKYTKFCERFARENQPGFAQAPVQNIAPDAAAPQSDMAKKLLEFYASHP
mgnify:CR=1 FL=1